MLRLVTRCGGIAFSIGLGACALSSEGLDSASGAATDVSSSIAAGGGSPTGSATGGTGPGSGGGATSAAGGAGGTGGTGGEGGSSCEGACVCELGGPTTFGTDGFDAAHDVAVGPNGETVIVGRFAGTLLSFGVGPDPVAVMQDVLIAKFQEDGTHVWTRAYGGSGDDCALHVDIDAQGAVVVAGLFEDDIDFGGQVLGVQNDNSDGFVVKLDADGKHVWSRIISGTSLEIPHELRLASNGDAVVVGRFAGTLDLGGDASSGVNDGFLAAFAATTGAVILIETFGADGDDAVLGVDVHATTGFLGVSGAFEETVDLGGPAEVTSAGGRDAFVAVADDLLVPVWQVAFGDGDQQEASRVVVTADGGAIVAGDFEGVIDFGTESVTAAGEYDVFVAAFDGTGTLLWARSHGGIGRESVNDLTVTPSGEIVITGEFEDTVDLGAGPVSSVERRDAFVLRLDAAGEHLCSVTFGGTGDQVGSGVASGASGVVVAGTFEDVIALGSDVMSQGGIDGWFTRLTSD